MTHEITASWDQLLADSQRSAEAHLSAAICATNDLPDGVDRTAVIVAYMHSASNDWLATSITVAAQRLCNALEYSASYRED